MTQKWFDWLRGSGRNSSRDGRSQTAEGPDRPRPVDASDWQPSPAYLRRSERLTQSALTPGFAEIREKAVKAIHGALGEHARPLGYRSMRSGWEKPGLLGAARVSIQRGSAGADCAINLEVVPRLGRRWEHPVRLGKFYRTEESDGIEPGWILYLDVAEDPHVLELPMRIFAERALPWLEASLTRMGRVAPETYIPDRT